MKSHFAHKHIILFSLLFSLSSFAFAQAFDDMPYFNPDGPTWFQQEMTALMRFQAEHNINVPFFASSSMRLTGGPTDIFDSLYAAYDHESLRNSGGWDAYYNYGKSSMIFNVLGGGQIKINNMFYIPVFFQFGSRDADTVIEKRIEKVNIWTGGSVGSGNHITEITGPAAIRTNSLGMFAGSGLFINTNIVKGGIYLGYSFGDTDEELIKMPYNRSYDNSSDNSSLYIITNETEPKAAFKIALVPLINTSQWAFVGKVLESIFGYFGMNDVLYASVVDEGDSKAAGFAKTINAALDFSFNRINLGAFDLDLNALYTRGNFDVAAKADTYGLRLVGSLSNFPFGFTLEGGYKHFYAVLKNFEQDYNNTGYFNGSIYFPLKKITLGIIYEYNTIYESTIMVAISTNFLKLFVGINPKSSRGPSGEFGGNVGWRFHYNGWKVGRE